MEKDAQTQNNLPPGSEPMTDQLGQNIPLIDTVERGKKVAPPLISETIQEISISEDEQGITIQYAKSPITKKAVTQILHWLEAQTGRQFAYTLPETDAPLLIFLQDVHDTDKPHEEISFENILPEPAFISITQQLDKTNINSLKTIIVKEGEGRDSVIEAQQRAELAHKFVYEDVSKIPPGIDPKQLDFLHDAATMGAFAGIHPETVQMITKYYTTEATYADIGKEIGITDRAVNDRIFRCIDRFYRVRPELASKYPPDQLKKGKNKTDVFKSEKSWERRSKASLEGKKRHKSDIFIANPPE